MSSRAGSAALRTKLRLALIKELSREEGKYFLKNEVECYGKLKRAYLKKIHDIHPDKNPIVNRTESTRRFRALQEAWESYEMVAQKSKERKEKTGNFTLFGVGCSFADNETERTLRNEIMDQAARGWFSAGKLVEDDEENSTITASERSPSPSPSLVDDSMFHDEKDETQSLSDRKPDW